VVSAPHRVKKVSGRETGQSGAVMFELYLPTGYNGNISNTRRAIASTYDGRWTFYASGEPPLEFENPAYYTARKIRDRFTPEILDEYLRHLDIRYYDPDYYDVPKPGYLVEKVGPTYERVREYTLEAAREE
jgi:hypothetical protein